MIYEYAIEPAFLSQCADRSSCKYLFDHFGSGTGRRPARFPKEWVREVIETTEGLSTMERERVVELAQLLKEASVRTGRSYNRSDGWVENARREHALRAFRAVLSTSKESPDFLTRDEVFSLVSIEPWDAPRTRVVARTPESMAQCMAPLLQLSSHIVLVDPYARPDKEGCRRLVRLCLEQAGRARARQIIRFEVVVGTQVTGPRHVFGTKWRSALTNCDSIVDRVVFWRLTKTDDGDILHNRYLITDVGGLSLGNSLDGFCSNETDDVSILDHKAYLLRRGQFLDSHEGYVAEEGEPVTVSL